VRYERSAQGNVRIRKLPRRSTGQDLTSFLSIAGNKDRKVYGSNQPLPVFSNGFVERHSVRPCRII